MEQYPVELSAIGAIGFDERRRKLRVTFADGSLYRYSDVPLRTFRGLMDTESKGAYFDDQIRGRFPPVHIR